MVSGGLFQHGQADEAATQLEEANGRLRAMVEFGRVINAELDLRSLLPLIPRRIAEIARIPAAAVILWDGERERPGQVETYGLPEDLPAIWRKAAAEGPCATGTELCEAVLSRRIAIYGDVATDMRLPLVRDLLLAAGLQSAAAVPLIGRDEFLGVVIAYDDQRRQVTEDEVAFFTAMVEVAATAVLNAQLYAATRRELRRREALRKVVESISSELDLDSLLARVVANAVDLLDASGGSIALLDRRGVPEVRAVHNLPLDLVGMKFSGGRGLTGRVVETHAPVVVAHYQRDLHDALANLPSVQAGIGVPIWWHGRLVGVFVVVDFAPSRAFADTDLETLELLANHVAIAIENARLYGEARQRLAEVIGLQAASAALVEELNPDRALRTVATNALALSEASTVSLELLQPGDRELEVRVAVGQQANSLVGRRFPADERIRAEVLHTGKPRVTHPARPARHSHPAGGEPDFDEFSVLILPLRARGRSMGTLSAYARDRAVFRPRQVEMLATFANQAAIALDNARVYAELHTRLEEILGLQRLGALLLQEHDFDRLLQAICEQLLQLTDAGGVGLALLEENQDFLELRTVVGPSAEALRGARIPIEGSFAGEALRTNQPQRSGDAMSDPRAYRPSIVLGNTHTILSVPMKTRRSVVGAISIYNKRGGIPFTERDAELATLFANQAAVAMENARLYERTREYAVVEERNRLARELHDSVTQSLFSVTLLSQAALSLWDRDPPKARERLERAADLAGGALAEMRALIFQLRPMALQEEGLVSALKKHAAALKSRHGLDVAVEIEGQERRLPSGVEEAAFRIAQESLNNVVKHAGVDRAKLRLEFGSNRLRICTEDQGVGFNPSGRAKPRTLGMSSMRERAEAVGGQITVESAPSVGTRVIVDLPIPPAEKDQAS